MVGLSAWFFVRIVRMLSRADAPALILQSDRISFDSYLHRAAIRLETIKAVSLLRPGSEQVGDKLHFELHPSAENGQRRWQSHTISLALLSASSSEIANAVEAHLTAFQNAAAKPSFTRAP